jgi:large subunit ribosomal protein L25
MFRIPAAGAKYRPMEVTTIKGTPRGQQGTRACRALRAEGRLPGVMYGHGEPTESVLFDQHDVEVALAHGARTLQVELKGSVKPYLIKEVQYDHLYNTPIHLDLARVDLTERVRVRVGIELRGVPKGVSEGGVLEQIMGGIEVECLVTDIPDTLHPFVSHLQLGQTLLVKDLTLPPGVKALANPDDRVATVRELAEAPVKVEAVEGEEKPQEPERIGRIRKEEPAPE